MARKFGPILKLAAGHHGGEKSVLAQSANTHAVRNLAKVPADRLLSVMTKCVFNAGFNWKVIEAKWDGFEAAFEGFDPGRLAFFGDEMLDRLVSDERIVRNGQKIKASLENARFVAEVESKEGGFGKFLANWPAEDQTGLMDALNKRGARLGGATAQYFLRFAGWDAWIASSHVCTALVREGVLAKPAATSKGDLARLQAAINEYHADSGLPRAQISRLLALSVG
ncbi:DNA-3-methyladenine glycosylase I [Hyphomonas sp.]|uniref:DNA-3-methyladenine glycosylase I n=1 Tax=Hyphomonas sp. TaxID=87 RepID=UPI0025BF8EB6|nr:DNA-3-methyladenine glycosylase I [Hyphomonas sp.]MBI1399994.1 DNA-3-methyladenine glycosylase I [Hyphomonas sp.]